MTIFRHLDIALRLEIVDNIYLMCNIIVKCTNAVCTLIQRGRNVHV